MTDKKDGKDTTAPKAGDDEVTDTGLDTDDVQGHVLAWGTDEDSENRRRV